MCNNYHVLSLVMTTWHQLTSEISQKCSCFWGWKWNNKYLIFNELLFYHEVPLSVPLRRSGAWAFPSKLNIMNYNINWFMPFIFCVLKMLFKCVRSVIVNYLLLSEHDGRVTVCTGIQSIRKLSSWCYFSIVTLQDNRCLLLVCGSPSSFFFCFFGTPWYNVNNTRFLRQIPI